MKKKPLKAWALETKNGNLIASTIRTRPGTLEGMLEGSSYIAREYRNTGCKIVEVEIKISAQPKRGKGK